MADVEPAHLAHNLMTFKKKKSTFSLVSFCTERRVDINSTMCPLVSLINSKLRAGKCSNKSARNFIGGTMVNVSASVLDSRARKSGQFSLSRLTFSRQTFVSSNFGTTQSASQNKMRHGTNQKCHLVDNTSAFAPLPLTAVQ